MRRYGWQLLYITIIKMTDTLDPELELEAQQISNYEDELAEFIDQYKNDKWFRMYLREKRKLYVIWEDWDECYAAYSNGDILYMSTSLDKCLKELFNVMRSVDSYWEANYPNEKQLPF